MSKRAKFANIVLGSFAILFLSLFLFSLIKMNLYPPGHMNKYFILSIAGFLFFVYSLLKCGVELKVKISLLVLSIALSLYAAEIILSYNVTVKPEPLRAKLAEDAGIPYDSRYKAQVWLDLRDKGIDAYPLYNPYVNMDIKWTEMLPLGFVSGRTTILCNESGEWILYKSDEHGFNNPEGLYDGKNIDYVLIGDSFTLGFCTKREKNIAGRLTRTGKKVLNLGMSNTGPPNQLAILKEYGMPFKPKFVFWFFFEGNDHEGLVFEKRSPTLLKYLEKDFSQHLIYKQKLIDEILIEYVEKEFAFIKENINSIIEKNKKREKATFNISLSSITLSQLRKRLGVSRSCECSVDPLFKDIFTESKRIVDGWDGQLVFVYLPDWNRYPTKVDKCRKRFLDTGKKDVIRVITDLGIPVIDIQSVFDSHPDPLSLFPFGLYGHYNSNAYKLIADEIEKYLSNNRENIKNHF